MMSSYRRILSRPGTALFSATGLLARLPISMVGLGIVLLVSAATGSYGLAGSVSAAYVLANGGFAILQGRLIDRLGQARVLASTVTVFGVALHRRHQSHQCDREGGRRHRQHPALTEPVDQPGLRDREGRAGHQEGRRHRAGQRVETGPRGDQQHDPEADHRYRQPRDEPAHREHEGSGQREHPAVGRQHHRRS